MPKMTLHQAIAALRQSRDHWQAAHAEDVSMLQREVTRLREVLAGIAAPLHIDGEHHMAAVQHARRALAAQAGEGNAQSPLLVAE
ncbi:MAG TPA: hypothetical protein VGK73_32515 [Polyangiaceae bacterium]